MKVRQRKEVNRKSMVIDNYMALFIKCFRCVQVFCLLSMLTLLFGVRCLKSFEGNFLKVIIAHFLGHSFPAKDRLVSVRGDRSSCQWSNPVNPVMGKVSVPQGRAQRTGRIHRSSSVGTLKTKPRKVLIIYSSILLLLKIIISFPLTPTNAKQATARPNRTGTESW